MDESAKAAESLSSETRFRTAVDALRLRAEEPEDGFPFVRSGNSKIELPGEASILFDVPGTATETGRRTRYSVGNDGRLYGAVEGQPLTPVGDVQAEAVLGALESEAAKASPAA